MKALHNIPTRLNNETVEKSLIQYYSLYKSDGKVPQNSSWMLPGGGAAPNIHSTPQTLEIEGTRISKYFFRKETDHGRESWRKMPGGFHIARKDWLAKRWRIPQKEGEDQSGLNGNARARITKYYKGSDLFEEFPLKSSLQEPVARKYLSDKGVPSIAKRSPDSPISKHFSQKEYDEYKYLRFANDLTDGFSLRPYVSAKGKRSVERETLTDKEVNSEIDDVLALWDDMTR